MRRFATTACLAACVGLLAAGFVPRALAGCSGCTGGCRECVPACRGTWEEKKSSKPVYSMKCDYACVRGRDSWHAPAPECRCHPPCGDVVVKKRVYKAEGPERVELVPKYEVTMVSAEPPRQHCSHCAATAGRAEEKLWWNPLDALRRCAAWW